jgi:hypothetical protein
MNQDATRVGHEPTIESPAQNHLNSVRRTRLVGAAPDCGFIWCASRHQIKAVRAVGTRGLVRSALSFAPNYCVVAVLHIVVLITTGRRAEEAVIHLLKKAPWMSRFMSGDHWKIVVKTQWTDVERHVQFLCGYCHGFYPKRRLVQIPERLICKEPG